MPDNRKKPLAPKAKELREIVGENVDLLMEAKGLDDRGLEGVPKSNVFRVRKAMGGTLDTVALIASALNVEPALLLTKGWAKQVSGVFTNPVPDSRLGDKWTRPDRRPLIEGKGNGRPTGDIPPKKRIKNRA